MAQATKSPPPDAAAACDALAPRDAAAWFGLLHSHAAVSREVDAELIAEHRLSMSSHEVLYRLSRSADGHLSVSALADEVLVSPSRVSRVVDDLNAKGLVERRSCPGDARVSHIAITDAGRGALEGIDDTFHAAVRRHFLDKLTQRELDALASAWRKLGAPSG